MICANQRVRLPVPVTVWVSRARVQQLRDQGIKGFRDQWEGDQ